MTGPEPFRFSPQPQTLEGAAFSRSFQAITLAVVAGSGYALISLLLQGKFGGDTPLEGLHAAGWFLLGWCLLAWTAWHVFKSRICIDGQGLHQTWLWDKHMAYDDLAFAKLIRVRGLEWLMAPRFYVRTLMGKFAVFYVSDPQALLECERMAKALQDFRKL